MTKLSCDKFYELFYLGVGNDLPEDVQQILMTHLGECSKCREEFEKIKHINGVFNSVRTNITKLEEDYNLEEVRSKNIYSIKNKLKLNKAKKQTYTLYPILMALAILVISISVLVFPQNVGTNTTNANLHANKDSSTEPESLLEKGNLPGKSENFLNIENKNDNEPYFSELRMKYSGVNLGHYIQGSCGKDISSASYSNRTLRVKVDNNLEDDLNPSGFKPKQTKVKCSLDDKQKEDFGF